MKKIDLKDNEQITIKSVDGAEFVYDADGLHKVSPQSKVNVLKSMRTEAGAKDWVRLAGKKDAQIVDTATLKGMYDGEEYLPELGYHVIMEEPVDMDAMSSGEFKEVLKALKSSGYLQVDEYGPCLTDKWHENVGKVMKEALSNVLKSTSEEINEESFGTLNSTQQQFVSIVADVTKSLEDSEALARLSGAPENADTGHERRPERPISDSEVESAEQREASGAVVGPGGEDASDPNMDGDDISDSEADTATHLADHNQGDSGVTREEYAVKSASEDSEEEDDAEGGDEDEVVDTTFKSLQAARQWQNPDPERYHVVPTTFDDKQKFGRNKSFIVKPRAPKGVFGAHGNKIV